MASASSSPDTADIVAMIGPETTTFIFDNKENVFNRYLNLYFFLLNI